ncbi:unnamed protein product [Cuscuta campestris]|uniref:Uncharacterized protein n=1 Tax=Cuscuta campestris TaxID=132261 RepID=A0A484LKK5_9ASTE|nr:unnamed protein product [Cuscuta campestris]
MGRPSNNYNNGYTREKLPASSRRSFWGGGYDYEEKEKQRSTGGSLVARNKSCNWTPIAKKTTAANTTTTGMGRVERSSKPRLSNQSRRQEIDRRDNFTPQEEELLIKLHATIGARWTIIAQQLPGRGEGEVKSVWNTKLKKKLTAMGIDPVTHKPFSQILSDYIGNVGGFSPSSCNNDCSPAAAQLQPPPPHFNATLKTTTIMSSNYTEPPPPLTLGDGNDCSGAVANGGNYTDLLSELQAIKSIANYSAPGPTTSSSLSSSSSLPIPSPVLLPTSGGDNNNNNDHEEEEEMMMRNDYMNSSSPAAGFSWCDFLLEDAFLPAAAGGDWGEGPQQPQGEFDDEGCCRKMASHRRNLAAASVDPTPNSRQQPISSSSTAAGHRHPNPDPTRPSTTIRSISRHFSNLYSNHKHLLSKASLKDGRLVDSSCPAALTKSKSQQHGGANSQPLKKKSHKEQDPDFIIKKSGSGGGGDEIKKSSADPDAKAEVDDYEEAEKRRPSLSQETGGGGGGRRRSFSSSKIELADFLSCNSAKVVAVDMPPFMQIHAVGCARKVFDSLEKFTSKALAFSLKKEFDGVYGPAWHCIVGKSFGSFVTHSVGGFIYFSMDPKLYVLLFKTTVQRAD